jgi:3-hydroxyisobutyrate dehydrogenase-like beta-hydroxyacid dehydrogenase
MTLLGAHRGPVSGTTHIHLLRESAAVRAARSAGLPRIAILGAGQMSSAIAGRLSAGGFHVTVWDKTGSTPDGPGIRSVASSAAEATRDADVILSSVIDRDAARCTYRGPNGALAAAEGKLIVEMSVAGPVLVSELATEVEAAGARMIDAPVLGAVDAVRTGSAVILAGGSAEDVQRATPILSRLGTVRCVGPLGSAARLRLLANNMLADIALAAAELRVGGDWAGLAPDDIYWVLQRLAPPLVTRLDPQQFGAR